MEAIRKIHLRGKTKMFENCDDIMLYDYMKIFETNDLKYLVKSGAIPKKQILQNKMEEINKEFAEIRGENNMIKLFDMISYKEELINKVHFGAVFIDMLQAQVACKIIASKTFDDIIAELESWDFYVDKEIPLIDALEIIKSEIEALQLTIDALNEEIQPKQKEDAVDATGSSHKSFNMHSLLFIYQRILKIDKIKIKETSLVEFAAIEKQVEAEKRKLTQNKNAE